MSKITIFKVNDRVRIKNNPADFLNMFGGKLSTVIELHQEKPDKPIIYTLNVDGVGIIYPFQGHQLEAV